MGDWSDSPGFNGTVRPDKKGLKGVGNDSLGLGKGIYLKKISFVNL
jgi:hypothetical protein